jgi:hypothetical protein
MGEQFPRPDFPTDDSDEATHPEPTPESVERLPVGAILASALMAANYPGDSGEDVDRLIDELAQRGYSLQPDRDEAAATPQADRGDALREAALALVKADVFFEPVGRFTPGQRDAIDDFHARLRDERASGTPAAER